jgi:hypothetical protein
MNESILIINNTKIIVTRPKRANKSKLERVYDTCNKIFKEDEYFYSSEEVERLKKDSTNIFL